MVSRKQIFLFFAAALFMMPLAVHAQGINLAQQFSFDGQLLDNAGNPKVGPVNIKFQIYDPTGASCLLFEETHTAVALDAAGNFSLKVGAGTRVSASVDGGLLMRNIFQNAGQVRATSSTNCTPGYTPATNDIRKLVVTVGSDVLTPAYSIAPMPMASVAESLQGKVPSDFVASSGATSLTGPLTASNLGEFRLGSNNANYIAFKAPTSLGSAITYTWPLTGGAANECLQTNGSGALLWGSCGGGGSLALTGGTMTGGLTVTNAAGITTSGTLSVAGNSTFTGASAFTGASNFSGTSTFTSGVQLNATSTATSPGLVVGTAGYGLFNSTSPNGVGVAAGGTQAAFFTPGGLALGALTNPTSLLDMEGAITIRGMAAPAIAPPAQGRIYYDSTMNKFRVSQNNAAFVDLLAPSLWTSSGPNAVFMSGNVGIGSSAPSQKLEVIGDTYISGNLGIGMPTPTDALEVVKSANSPVQVKVANTTTGASAKAGFTAINNSGLSASFGIVSSSYSAGGVIAPNDAYLTANNGVLNIQATGTGMGVRIATGASPGAATARVRITDTGNVGIGNMTPVNLLHVGSSAVGSGLAVANFQNVDGTCTITPASSGSGIACSSDERLKENFQDVSGTFALDRIMQLQAVSYNFKTSSTFNRRTGYRAQEVQKVAPEFVRENDDGFLQVYYDAFVPWITEAIKALNGQIRDIQIQQNRQDREIASARENTLEMAARLEAEVARLKADDIAKDEKIRELERRLEKLENSSGNR